ncbi:putative mitochondrial protein [Andalucia godoyi]|uniref:Putative mitochondrial protein n=1 Tax=Andalucia godoyi TaxID=505711 RepID=A0A8K0AJU7_ANDGO|nr:putative mitochondrial protein [Andalucia godoyi]|eukprot:ANDGO_08790.mRNA.1 putative mitochondrial protein
MSVSRVLFDNAPLTPSTAVLANQSRAKHTAVTFSSRDIRPLAGLVALSNPMLSPLSISSAAVTATATTTTAAATAAAASSSGLVTGGLSTEVAVFARGVWESGVRAIVAAIGLGHLLKPAHPLVSVLSSSASSSASSPSSFLSLSATTTAPAAGPSLVVATSMANPAAMLQNGPASREQVEKEIVQSRVRGFYSH